MSTPLKGKTIRGDFEVSSPKNFRWLQPFENSLLELLIREVCNGNRPDHTFTASAYRNIVKDFNDIHGTNITKKHVINRIKTMKGNYALFHQAFKGLSGFAWNSKTNKFEAEDHVWEERIKENPKLAKLRDKSIHNWDKLRDLWGDTHATGEHANMLASNADSCFGDHHSPTTVPEEPTTDYVDTQQSEGSARSKRKRKASLISVMEDGYKTMAASIDKLSMALLDSGEKVAGSKFDVLQNSQIYAALQSLGLPEEYHMRCYCYLCAHPSKGALLVGAPLSIRGKLLDNIMQSAK
ncbi:hypothetical protein MLD38_017125 [Melastoma candidum]|uniref:Uncharacterized protein n=1 Tax=Melastoma candidum TaxID=119954 RepID=A0ACB9QNV2_9MYRT|nr:hypothetical protein MLD38_017125 [Melastoma candidum]